MKLEDIATLAPDGWWEIRQNVTLSGSDTLVIDRNTRICGSAWLNVTGSAWLHVTGSAWLSVTDSAGLNVTGSAGLSVTDSAGLNVTGSAWLSVTGSAGLSVTGSAGLNVTGSAWLNVTGSAWLSVTGWHELARDTWALLRSPDGLYYAGCRGPFTREQALAHWDREDDRACLFTLAILMCDQKEKRLG